MGGSFSKASASGDTQFDQRGWGPQTDAAPDFFNAGNNLWNNSQGAFNQIGQLANYVTPYLGQIAAQALQPWQQQSLGGASSGMANETYQGLADSLNQSLAGGQSQQGKLYEDIIGGPGNTYADPLVNQMAEDSQRNMQRNVMPGIRDQAAAAGQGGSSRHGISEGLAIGDENQRLSSAQNAVRANEYDRDMGWKMDIARQADQQLSASQDRAMRLIDNMDRSQQYGLGQSGNLQNLGVNTAQPYQNAAGMPFDAYQSYSQAGGFSDPAILSFGSGSNNSNNFGASGGMGGGK